MAPVISHGSRLERMEQMDPENDVSLGNDGEPMAALHFPASALLWWGKGSANGFEAC